MCQPVMCVCVMLTTMWCVTVSHISVISGVHLTTPVSPHPHRSVPPTPVSSHPIASPTPLPPPLLQAEVQENIGHALALIGPSLTLDTLVTALAIGVGIMSGVPKLELICCFGCVTIISNFVVFITFFPASLALALEVCSHTHTCMDACACVCTHTHRHTHKHPHPHTGSPMCRCVQVIPHQGWTSLREPCRRRRRRSLTRWSRG